MSHEPAPPQEPPRDGHLRAALRHAPDAQMQASQALSARILGQARAKTRAPATPAPRASFIAAWWQRLTQPALATGLAGVLAATVVGLMWWQAPLDHAEAPRPVAAQTPPPVQAAREPAPAAAPSPESAREASPQVRPDKRDSVDRVAQHSAKKVEGEASLSKKRRDERATDAHAADDPNAPPAAAQRTRETAAAQAPVPVPAPVPSEITAPLPAIEAAAPRKAPAAQARAADVARGMASAAGNAASPFATSPGTAAAGRLAALRLEIAAAPSRWQSERNADAARPIDDALLQWLALAQARATTWLPVGEPMAASAPASASHELRLLHDGQVTHVLRLSDSALQWQQSAMTLQAPLSTSAANELRSALDAATR